MNDTQIINIRLDILEPLLKIQEILFASVKSIEEKVDNQGINDIRIITINSTLEDIIGSLGFLSCSIILCTNFHFSEFQALIDNNKIDKIQAQKTMNDYIRLTILVVVHFKIEHLFATLLKTIDKFPQSNNNFRCYIGLLRDIIKGKDDDYNTLITLNYMRNCLHTGGKHDKKDFFHNIDGIEFQFIQGQGVHYSIKYVLVLLERSIAIVCEWIQKEPFLSMTKEIADISD